MTDIQSTIQTYWKEYSLPCFSFSTLLDVQHVFGHSCQWIQGLRESVHSRDIEALGILVFIIGCAVFNSDGVAATFAYKSNFFSCWQFLSLHCSCKALSLFLHPLPVRYILHYLPFKCMPVLWPCRESRSLVTACKFRLNASFSSRKLAMCVYFHPAFAHAQLWYVLSLHTTHRICGDKVTVVGAILSENDEMMQRFYHCLKHFSHYCQLLFFNLNKLILSFINWGTGASCLLPLWLIEHHHPSLASSLPTISVAISFSVLMVDWEKGILVFIIGHAVFDDDLSCSNFCLISFLLTRFLSLNCDCKAPLSLFAPACCLVYLFIQEAR